MGRVIWTCGLKKTKSIAWRFISPITGAVNLCCTYFQVKQDLTRNPSTPREAAWAKQLQTATAVCNLPATAVCNLTGATRFATFIVCDSTKPYHNKNSWDYDFSDLKNLDSICLIFVFLCFYAWFFTSHWETNKVFYFAYCNVGIF